jgi:hypothetical protein
MPEQTEPPRGIHWYESSNVSDVVGGCAVCGSSPDERRYKQANGQSCWDEDEWIEERDERTAANQENETVLKGQANG